MVRLAAVLFCVWTAWAQDSQEGARASYNQLYGQPEKVFSEKPNAFLMQMLEGRKPGRALDIGMGQGRNALWLAGRGWDVTGIDISDAGVEQAKAEAKRLGLRLQAERIGYADFAYGEMQWDLIVLCYFIPRELPGRLLKALRPGGVIVLEGFHADTAYLRLLPDGFADNEILTLFSGYRILHYEDATAQAEWGTQLGGMNRLVRLVAQRPMGSPETCSFQGGTYSRDQEVCWGPLRMRCGQKGWLRAGACENSQKHD